MHYKHPDTIVSGYIIIHNYTAKCIIEHVHVCTFLLSGDGFPIV